MAINGKKKMAFEWFLFVLLICFLYSGNFRCLLMRASSLTVLTINDLQSILQSEHELEWYRISLLFVLSFHPSKFLRLWKQFINFSGWFCKLLKYLKDMAKYQIPNTTIIVTKCIGPTIAANYCQYVRSFTIWRELCGLWTVAWDDGARWEPCLDTSP